MARHHALLARSYTLRAESCALEAEAAIQRPDYDADRRAAAAAALLEDAALYHRAAARHARLARGLPEHDDPPDFSDVLATPAPAAAAAP